MSKKCKVKRLAAILAVASVKTRPDGSTDFWDTLKAIEAQVEADSDFTYKCWTIVQIFHYEQKFRRSKK